MVGTKDSFAEQMEKSKGRVRRGSVIAMETEKEIDTVAPDQKAECLLRAVSKEAMKREGPDFSFWALACCNDIIMHGDTDTASTVEYFTSKNSGDLDSSKDDVTEEVQKAGTSIPGVLMSYMTEHKDNILVQYAGHQVATVLANSEDSCKKLASTDLMKHIMGNICDTDAPELIQTGLTALKSLVTNSEACRSFETEDLKQTIKSLMEDLASAEVDIKAGMILVGLGMTEDEVKELQTKLGESRKSAS